MISVRKKAGGALEDGEGLGPHARCDEYPVSGGNADVIATRRRAAANLLEDLAGDDRVVRAPVEEKGRIVWPVRSRHHRLAQQ